MRGMGYLTKQTLTQSRNKNREKQKMHRYKKNVFAKTKQKSPKTTKMKHTKRLGSAKYYKIF